MAKNNDFDFLDEGPEDGTDFGDKNGGLFGDDGDGLSKPDFNFGNNGYDDPQDAADQDELDAVASAKANEPDPFDVQPADDEFGPVADGPDGHAAQQPVPAAPKPAPVQQPAPQAYPPQSMPPQQQHAPAPPQQRPAYPPQQAAGYSSPVKPDPRYAQQNAAPQYQGAPPQSAPKPSFTQRSTISTNAVSVEEIAKIIAAVDRFREMEKQYQDAVREFLCSVNEVDSGTYSSEAAVVSGVLRLTPRYHDAVHNLVVAYGKSGADRVFFLIGLTPQQLDEVLDVLSMLTDVPSNTNGRSEADTIRVKAQAINSSFEPMANDQIEYLRQIDSLLTAVREIMKK